MPVLKTPGMRDLLKRWHKARVQSRHYATAGFKPNRSHASRLVAKGNVRKRVEEIKSKVSEKAEWTAADRLIAPGERSASENDLQ